MKPEVQEAIRKLLDDYDIQGLVWDIEDRMEEEDWVGWPSGEPRLTHPWLEGYLDICKMLRKEIEV